MGISKLGRVALVTGGSRGIGRSIALRLAADGADVAITYARDRNAADEVVAQARAIGVRACAIPGLVECWDDCVSIVGTAIEHLGSIGILVNNAGMASYGRALADVDRRDVERAMAVNAFGSFYLSKLALPELRKHSRSDIILIGSTSSAVAAPLNGPYNMSKASVDALGITLAREERANGVRVHIIAPTLTATDMGNGFASLYGVSDLREIDAQSPFGRVCLPEDIAALASHLVSSENYYVSGQRITVDAATGDPNAGVRSA